MVSKDQFFDNFLKGNIRPITPCFDTLFNYENNCQFGVRLILAPFILNNKG